MNVVIRVSLDLSEALAQVDQLKAALAAAAGSSPGPSVGGVVLADALDNLPVGSVVDDVEHDRWIKRADGWHVNDSTYSGYADRAGSPRTYGPFTICELPEAVA